MFVRQLAGLGSRHDCLLCRARVLCRVSVLTACLSVRQDLLRGCLDQIEEMILEFTAEQTSRAAAAGADPASELAGEYHTAETPTDVREVHF